MVVGSIIGNEIHEMTEFLIPGEMRKGPAELSPWSFRGQTLACLGHW